MTAAHVQLTSAVTLDEVVEKEWRYLNLGIPVDRSVLEAVALHVSMLAEGVIERVKLVSPGKPARIEASTESGFALQDGLSVVRLAERELEFLLSFLLVYYRDGAADVDHIDIQLPSEDADSVDVTVTVDRSKPPGTPEDARRLLFGDETG